MKNRKQNAIEAVVTYDPQSSGPPLVPLGAVFPADRIEKSVGAGSGRGGWVIGPPLGDGNIIMHTFVKVVTLLISMSMLCLLYYLVCYVISY